MGGYLHRPVMVREVTELLAPIPTGTVVDATVGGGGHARSLLEARPDLRLLGIDRDPSAVAAARVELEPFGDRAQIIHGGFEHIAEIVRHEHEGIVMGILFDLGVSSPQLDLRERGFTYWGDAPLDMRMDSAQPLTAEQVVNDYDVDTLTAVLRGNGEERFAALDRGAHRRQPAAAHDQRPGARRPGGDPAAGPPAGRSPGASHLPGHPHGGEPRAPAPRGGAGRVGASRRPGGPHPGPLLPLA